MKRQVAGVLLCAVVLSGGAISARAQASSSDKAAIETAYKQFAEAFTKKDVKGIMVFFAPDAFVYDVIPPREYASAAAYKKDWEGLFATLPGAVKAKVADVNITVAGTVAYTHDIVDATMTDKDGKPIHTVVRSTDVWRKTSGKWLIVQEHNSCPVDLATGQADLLSKP